MKTANRKRRLVALTVTFLAALSVTVATSPAANAQTNRRICVYSAPQTWHSPTGVVTAYSQWAMNYKKKGGCPTNGNSEALREGAGSTALEKITCEQFGDRARATTDPCPGMNMDSMYYVEWYPDGATTSFGDFGHY